MERIRKWYWTIPEEVSYTAKEYKQGAIFWAVISMVIFGVGIASITDRIFSVTLLLIPLFGFILMADCGMQASKIEQNGQKPPRKMTAKDLTSEVKGCVWAMLGTMLFFAVTQIILGQNFVALITIIGLETMASVVILLNLHFISLIREEKMNCD